jgi:hypothetical protein
MKKGVLCAVLATVLLSMAFGVASADQRIRASGVTPFV